MLKRISILLLLFFVITALCNAQSVDTTSSDSSIFTMIGEKFPEFSGESINGKLWSNCLQSNQLGLF
jgi:hypothetical protein